MWLKISFLLLFTNFPGVEYSDKDLISVRIKALNPGKAKIHATVILSCGQKITNSVEVVGKYEMLQYINFLLQINMYGGVQCI